MVNDLLQRTLQIRNLLMLIMIALLCSCTHMSKKDGPPNYYVDVSKIPNAVPKPERLSKYGNMRVYRVFGKNYYPLRASDNYNQVGIASWYGTKFHSRRTSSGEPYDMLAMTAAHKTLPLPTYVEVTNLKNQRKIIVKVNDRGPFMSNRLIDLSYVAARKLNIVGHGTAYVRVKAINPYTFGRDNFYLAENQNRTTSRTTTVTTTRTYRDYLYSNKPLATKKTRPFRSYAHANQRSNHVYLQVGVFRQKVHAINLKRRLTRVLATPVKISDPKAKRGLYMVHVGPIKDLATADRISNQLKRLGVKSRTMH